MNYNLPQFVLGSPQSQLVLAQTREKTVLFDLLTEEISFIGERRLTASEQYRAVLCPSFDRIVSASYDGLVVAWDMKLDRKWERMTTSKIKSLRLCGAKPYVIACGDGKEIWIDLKSGNVLFESKLGNMFFSDQGTYGVCEDGKTGWWLQQQVGVAPQKAGKFQISSFAVLAAAFSQRHACFSDPEGGLYLMAEGEARPRWKKSFSDQVFNFQHLVFLATDESECQTVVCVGSPKDDYGQMIWINASNGDTIEQISLVGMSSGALVQNKWFLALDGGLYDLAKRQFVKQVQAKLLDITKGSD